MPDYTYHPDLARYAHMKSTLSPWFVRLSHGPMKLLYAAQQSGGAVRVSRLSVPRSDGSCLRMLLYAPAGCEGETPCVYFLHGGGFVFNAAPHHFALAGELARALGVRGANYLERASETPEDWYYTNANGVAFSPEERERLRAAPSGLQGRRALRRGRRPLLPGGKLRRALLRRRRVVPYLLAGKNVD